MNCNVAIEKCDDYDADKVFAALKRAVEAAGGLDVRDKTVLLKPNILSDAAPERAVTTHPAFLEASIRLVREAGARRILVGDSPGVQGPGFQARGCQLGPVCARCGAEWCDFTKGKTERACPDGRAVKSFTFCGALQEADLVIGLPKLKNHQLMTFTGALKNLFGLIVSVGKSTYHVRFPSQAGFARMIVDLNLAVKPHYTLMDAITGMEGQGPGSGKPRHLGLVLASPNPLALDMAACTIVGYPPEQIPINREALSRGVWLNSAADIRYPLCRPEEVACPDFEKLQIKRGGSQLAEFLMPGFLRRLRDARAPRPVIDQQKCVRCGECTRICASNAAVMTGEGASKRVEINYRRCIRCYCCHEVCPAKAITVK